MSQRTAVIERNSKETQIKCVLNVDGTGKSSIATPIGLLSHMLDLFTFHGLFDLELAVTGDTHIDIHHTNEDIGIVLGKAFKKALGEEKSGIRRFGFAGAPMEATVSRCVIDISGRGYYRFNLEGDTSTMQAPMKEEDGYKFAYLEHFMESFAHNLGATLSITLQNPSDDIHTNMEAVFKSLALALDRATQIDPRREGAVPSTKGIID